MEDIDLMREIARQLRCPSGETAMEVGDNMYASNGSMIFKTIDHLSLRRGQMVLEMGFGNGGHLSYLFGKTADLQYWGVDISEAMVLTAKNNNNDFVREGKAVFQLVDGTGKLPYADDHSDTFFTVNTLYFWQDIPLQLKEIYRVLKTGGRITIAYIEKSFGEKQPFTQVGFSFYEKEEVEKHISDAGFKKVHTDAHIDETVNKEGKKVTRPYFVVSGEK